MTITTSLLLGLDDLLAEFRHARRSGDLGRLALIAYCDVRRWARLAGEAAIADRAASMFTAEPHASREAFLGNVDALMADLERAQDRLAADPWVDGKGQTNHTFITATDRTLR